MRNEIKNVLLKRDSSAITQASANGYGATSDDHDGSEVERMKRNPSENRAPVHHVQGKAEDVGTIAALSFQLEMHPAEDEREGNQRGEDAAPHNQRVHQPARETAPCDKLLLDQIVRNRLCRARRVGQKFFALAEELPAAPPVDARRGTPQPQRIAIDQCAEGHDARHRVAEERGIVMLKVARADDDERSQKRRRAETE